MTTEPDPRTPRGEPNASRLDFAAGASGKPAEGIRAQAV
jgi:hypothetical protein